MKNVLPSPERLATLVAEYGRDAQMRKLIALYDSIGEEVAAKRFDRQTRGRDSLLGTVTDGRQDGTVAPERT